MTLDEIRTFVRTFFEFDEEDLPNLLIDTWAGEAQNRILRARRDWPHLEVQTSLVTETGLGSYPLPTDLRTIIHVEHPTNGRLRSLYHPIAEQVYFQSGGVQSGTPDTYSRWGTLIFLWPQPIANETLQVYGYRAPLDFVAAGGSSAPDLPVDFHQAVLEWVMAKSYLFEDDPEMAAIHRQTFDDLLAVYVSDEVQPDPVAPLIFGGGGSTNSSGAPSDSSSYFRVPPIY